MIKLLAAAEEMSMFKKDEAESFRKLTEVLAAKNKRSALERSVVIMRPRTVQRSFIDWFTLSLFFAAEICRVFLIK